MSLGEKEERGDRKERGGEKGENIVKVLTKKSLDRNGAGTCVTRARKKKRRKKK